MSTDPHLLALRLGIRTCRGHHDALRDALADIAAAPPTAAALVDPGKAERRLLDQFAYRYTRLQDDLGARLMPAILRALGEDIAAMPVLDRLNRLEQLGWLPSTEEWMALRRIRNAFAHDYPETADERHERLQLALAAAGRLLEIFDGLQRRADDRFGPDGSNAGETATTPTQAG